MTKKGMEKTYYEVMDCISKDGHVAKRGLYMLDGILVPGMVWIKQDENIMHMRTTYWNTEKQLTIKQLVKLLAVWEECVIKEKE